MTKKILFFLLIIISISFSIFTLSIPVDANPPLRPIKYEAVCCGQCQGGFDWCVGSGIYICCIPVE
jgi:hypothetical protein